MASFKAITSDTEAIYEIRTTYQGTNTAMIEGFADATTATIEHTADSHTFSGKINNNTLQEFADDAAAVTGGLVPGDFYYTSDAGSGFLKVVLPGV